MFNTLKWGTALLSLSAAAPQAAFAQASASPQLSAPAAAPAYSAPKYVVINADGEEVSPGEAVAALKDTKHFVIGDTNHLDEIYAEYDLFDFDILDSLDALGVKTLNVELPTQLQPEVDNLIAGTTPLADWARDTAALSPVSSNEDLLEDVTERMTYQGAYMREAANRGMAVKAVDVNANDLPNDIFTSRAAFNMRMEADEDIGHLITRDSDGKTATIIGSLHDGLSDALAKDGPTVTIDIYSSETSYYDLRRVSTDPNSADPAVNRGNRADILFLDDQVVLTDTASLAVQNQFSKAGFTLQPYTPPAPEPARPLPSTPTGTGGPP